MFNNRDKPRFPTSSSRFSKLKHCGGIWPRIKEKKSKLLIYRKSNEA